MAAVTLSMNTPVRDTAESSINTRRRFVVPTTGGATWFRIFSTAELYLERVDAADATSRGSTYETLAANTVHTVAIRRGEFAISAGTASAVVEVTALSRVGPG